MAAHPLRTSDLAKALGVHVNTIRLYEASGFLPPIPRAPNGYRQFSVLHLEHARLVHLALRWPYVGNKTLLLDLVHTAARGDLAMAMELAYTYLIAVRTERTIAEAALEFLERWAAGQVVEPLQHQIPISAAARHLRVTVDMLRSWERNGLIDVPRDPATRYRQYGAAEFGRLRVIRTLVQAGYSLTAVLRMLQQFDAGSIENLRQALDVPPEDDPVTTVADRWLSSLLDLEQRAQTLIRQIGRLIELTIERASACDDA